MTIAYIRKTYSVPAMVGGRVKAYGKLGTITGTNGAHLMIRLDGLKHSNPYHPTDEIEYDPKPEPEKTPEPTTGEANV